ncbi:DUF1127 domain-containing protein [Marinovum sp.]|uniref:DUF1127 domain-containing protein n=1 Tax=Marinovum sp. TaxID=2024839 RepID=UPI002B2790CE|nr:DUF1127 domain-containing protein [Marinovum sp.]
MAHLHQTQVQATGFLDGRSLTPIASVALKVVVAIAKWEFNHRTRTRLKHLDDHMLRDIGVTRDLADREATRPFWQG